MASKRCIVPGCNSRGSGGYSLFYFPNLSSDGGRRKQWLQNIGVSEEILNSNTCVCERHFENKYILTFPTRPKKLRDDAVSGINLWMSEVRNNVFSENFLFNKENIGYV
jgi:hypothetical protein